MGNLHWAIWSNLVERWVQTRDTSLASGAGLWESGAFDKEAVLEITARPAESWGRCEMRHLFIGAAMLIGALVLTSIASVALESRATAHAQPPAYEPPSLVASPSTYNKKSDSVISTSQRARPRVIGADGRV